MQILLKDGSLIDVIRMYKTHDFLNPEIRLTIEVNAAVKFEDLENKDFSKITLKRVGHEDVLFEGYTVSDIQETYDIQSYSLLVSLTK